MYVFWFFVEGGEGLGICMLDRILRGFGLVGFLLMFYESY